MLIELLEPRLFASADTIAIEHDFAQSRRGWRANLADTFGGTEVERVQFRRGRRMVPSPVGGWGYLLGGTNVTDDLFMFMHRRLTQRQGIKPDQRYRIRFEIDLASNASADCLGVGGSPASVFVKVGATTLAPTVTDPGPNDLRSVSFDKGNQSQGGRDASTAGTIDNGQPCTQPAEYAAVTLTHTHRPAVRADREGRLHLVIGFDSGFESRTEIYVTGLRITLTRLH